MHTGVQLRMKGALHIKAHVLRKSQVCRVQDVFLNFAWKNINEAIKDAARLHEAEAVKICPFLSITGW